MLIFVNTDIKKNLLGISIYGSYVWGYFDRGKSDYDVFLIFKNKLRKENKFLEEKFKRIVIHYFCTSKEMLHLIKKGYWSPYITFLVNARMIYYFPKYKNFIFTLKNMDFVKSLLSTKRIEWKAKFDPENKLHLLRWSYIFVVCFPSKTKGF